MVVEAIPERLPDKRALFAELARACPGPVLATNTSSLPVIELAVATGSPERVVGLHFFNPAPVMKLVELASTVATSSDARDRARAFAESLGKTVVACRDRAGFIANLLLFPYLNEAVKLLDGGYARREDIDTAMKLGAGHPMGPLELIDLVGLDACAQILESLAEQFAEPRFAPAPALRQLVTSRVHACTARYPTPDTTCHKKHRVRSLTRSWKWRCVQKRATCVGLSLCQRWFCAPGSAWRSMIE